MLQSVKLTSSSDQCTCSLYMHNDCFLDFEDDVLQYLKLAGRSRSWSEKQKRQNIWTKRGYDIAFKACLCKCKKGYLKKDLDQIDDFEVAPTTKSKKKKRKSNEKPILILSTSPTSRNRTISGLSEKDNSLFATHFIAKKLYLTSFNPQNFRNITKNLQKLALFKLYIIIELVCQSNRILLSFCNLSDIPHILQV